MVRMWTREFTQTGSQLALLIAQFIVILLSLFYIQHVYFVNVYPDKHVKENFGQTECFVASKQLTTKGHVIHRYRANFNINYTVNGVQYNKWVSGNGLDSAYTHNREVEEDILSQYTQGNSYPCWYNPDNAAQVVLVLRHSWMSTTPLIVPSLVAVLTFYFFLKNLFEVMGKATIKAREVRQKRKEN